MSEQGNWSLPPLESVEAWHKARRRKRIAIWGTVAVLAAAGLFAGWRYSYPVVQRHQSLLAQLPGLQNSLASAGKRMDDTEERLRAWAGDRDSLRERMAKLDGRITHSLQLARKQTQELAAQLQQRLQATQARVERLESTQESDRMRLAKVQEELSAVREEMRREVDQKVQLARQDASQGLADINQQLVKVGRQADHSERDLGAIARQLERQRVDFEAPRNQTRELVSGVSLNITRTNSAHRRFDGWLWLLPDRRTIWVRGQGVQQPVVFYSKQDSRPHELVITHVSKVGVAGYLLAPAGEGVSTAAALRSGHAQ